jgi:hypothetical protein
MISMVRALAAFVVIAITVCLPVAGSHAENVKYVSANGTGDTCTAAAPCAAIGTALVAAGVSIAGNSGRVICVGGSAADSSGFVIDKNVTVDVDCPQGFMAAFTLSGNITARFRHLGFRFGGFFANLITVSGGGTLILEDCVFTDATGAALDIEPSGPLNLVIRNSRMSTGGSGILLKPAAGGSVKATLDHVAITGNNGGGIKADSTNGVVNLDVTDSEISNNGGNGINVIAGASQNIVSIKNSVIARNGAAGVQANGGNAGVLLQTTLLDQNVTGATSVVSGGNMFTYGNNSIIGSAGSGFNHSAGLQ